MSNPGHDDPTAETDAVRVPGMSGLQPWQQRIVDQFTEHPDEQWVIDPPRSHGARSITLAELEAAWPMPDPKRAGRAVSRAEYDRARADHEATNPPDHAP